MNIYKFFIFKIGRANLSSLLLSNFKSRSSRVEHFFKSYIVPYNRYQYILLLLLYIYSARLLDYARPKKHVVCARNLSGNFFPYITRKNGRAGSSSRAQIIYNFLASVLTFKKVLDPCSTARPSFLHSCYWW